MIELILKNNIERNKIEALINFLKSWNIDAEIKVSTEIESKKETGFTLNSGIWKDNDIDANELRKQAWKR